MSRWKRHDLLDIQDLSVEEIETVLETAQSFKEVLSRDVKKVPALRGKTIATVFFEDSTRTRVSFEIAAKCLSADTLNVVVKGSSMSKGESVLDMAKNIEAMNADLLIVRHSCSGIPDILAKHLKASVVNAGDGCRAHPTQALLDLFTIREKLGKINGLNVLIVGDILHSRVARSNIYGFIKLGAKVTVCGPTTLMPIGIETLGVNVSHDLDEAIASADVVMLLRIQTERQQEKFLPSMNEYARKFGVNRKRLEKAKKGVVIMHPGPTNRGIELSAEVADGEHSVILDQVNNGVAVRMAVLYLLLGTKDSFLKDL